MLEYKVDINSESDVFSSSVMGGNIEMIQLLINEFNQDPLLAEHDDMGNSPLHWACLWGHEELARLLITNYNSAVDVRNKKNGHHFIMLV